DSSPQFRSDPTLTRNARAACTSVGRVRSWSHRWVERILAFGGLAYWIVTTYLGLVFAAALLTSLTDLSTLRILAVLGLVLAAFAAMFMHRWRPRAARFAHLAMLGAAALTLGTCAEMVEL